MSLLPPSGALPLPVAPLLPPLGVDLNQQGRDLLAKGARLSVCIRRPEGGVGLTVEAGIDTGSSGFQLDRDLASQLGGPTRGCEILHTADGAIDVEQRVYALEFPGHGFLSNNGGALCSLVPGLREQCGVAAMVGRETLGRGRFLRDGPDGTWRLVPPTAASLATAGRPERLAAAEGLRLDGAVLRAQICHPEHPDRQLHVRTLIDTGTRVSVVDVELARHLELPERLGERCAAAGGGSRLRPYFAGEIRLPEIGPLFRPHSELMGLSLSSDPRGRYQLLLGRDALASLRLHFDGANCRVHLSDRSGRILWAS